MSNLAMQRNQLSAQRRMVDFDSYDVTVDELVRRVSRQRIEIAPAYQRQFRWTQDRQSKLVESLLLGIPIPSLFMATNIDNESGTTWEVVDGLQRLLTLVNFLSDTDVRKSLTLSGPPLKLMGLEKLDSMNGFGAQDLPKDIITSLEDRPIKVIVLNDKSELKVRFDLFERLNTGGIKLTNQEVRECVYMGDFVDLLTTLAESDLFRAVVHLPKNQQDDGTAQEYVLRFFAFKEKYSIFQHSVKDFLNDFCSTAAKNPKIEEREIQFRNTFEYLAQAFPDGLKRRKGATPVNLFEGVSVGAALALEIRPDLTPTNTDWILSDELHRVVTGATNDRSKVAGRIEISRDNFLGNQ